MLGVKKWIFFSNNLHETELFSSQRREMLFVLGHQHGSRDVTFKPISCCRLLAYNNVKIIRRKMGSFIVFLTIVTYLLITRILIMFFIMIKRMP